MAGVSGIPKLKWMGIQWHDYTLSLGNVPTDHEHAGGLGVGGHKHSPVILKVTGRDFWFCIKSACSTSASAAQGFRGTARTLNGFPCSFLFPKNLLECFPPIWMDLTNPGYVSTVVGVGFWERAALSASHRQTCSCFSAHASWLSHLTVAQDDTPGTKWALEPSSQSFSDSFIFMRTHTEDAPTVHTPCGYCLLKNINQSTENKPLYLSPLEPPFLQIMGLWKVKQIARNQDVRHQLLCYPLMEEIHRQSITQEVAGNTAGKPKAIFPSYWATNFRLGIFVPSKNHE